MMRAFGLSAPARHNATHSSKGRAHPSYSHGISNRLYQRALGIQAKLAVSAPDDAYEREADRVAEHVMRMSAETAQAPGLSRMQSSVQRKCAECEEEDAMLQRKAAGPAPHGVAPANPIPGTGSSLTASARAFFEPRLDRDLSDVRVHTGRHAAEIAGSMQARAFTYGRHIVFGDGEYSPDTTSGRFLLAHELAHTIQQGASSHLIQRRVRANLVSCRNPSAALQPVVGADPVATLESANARAVELLDNAISTLEFNRNAIIAGAEPAWPTVGDATAAALRDRFGLDPEDRAVWTGAGERTVQIIIRRLRLVRRILDGGWLAYTCVAPAAINTPTCAGAGCVGATRAVSCTGTYRLFLCSPWWGAAQDYQARTMIHECHHIAFGFIGDAGHWANAHCYANLVLDLGGVAEEALFAGACA